MNIDIDKSERAIRAMKNFREGYNCSQSVVLAFEEELDVDRRTLLRISSSFGGGMGRLREVCGSVSGMFMVAGLLYGYDEAGNIKGKKELYEKIQELAGEFSDRNGSIVCHDLLGLRTGPDRPEPEARTEEYYRKRPCIRLIGMAAAILDEFMNKYGRGTL